MIIVLNSNIFVSALIKEGTTRKLIVECKEWLIIPEYFFQETRNHREEIISKSGLNREGYKKLFNLLLKYVFVIPNEIILPYREEALEIVKDIDVDDALFIATALAFDCAVVWSNDKKLKKQNKIKVFSTSEMIKLIE